ncbi:MAG: hypothetical protein RLZZ70_479 [Candidatus Parcubacteria bacterium]|jgi:hypothetical protein
MIASMHYRIGLFFAIMITIGVGLIWGTQHLPSAGVIWREAEDFIPTTPEETLQVFIPKEDTLSPTIGSASGTPTRLPTDTASDTAVGNTAPVDDSASWLTPGQRQMLETFGIDVATLPQELSPALAACLTGAWGEARFAEITSGDTPTFFEGTRAVSCL